MFAESEEQDPVECIDCGAELVAMYPNEIEPRCDSCNDHHFGLCGPKCPILQCTNRSDHGIEEQSR